MQRFERKILLPFARGLFNLYGLLGFLAIIFGVGAALYSQTTQEIMSRKRWLNSNVEEASNTRSVITTMSTTYNTEEEEKRIQGLTGYMYNNPAVTKLALEKTKYGECLSKSTYEDYTYIENPEQFDSKTFPWSVWKTNEFEWVLANEGSIDASVLGEDFINAVCKKVHTSSDPLKPKHISTNSPTGYSPWMDLGYRVQAVFYAEARYDDYSNRVFSENLQKQAALPVGLWSIAAGSGAVAAAALLIAFMGIESNLRELEKRPEAKTGDDKDLTSS